MSFVQCCKRQRISLSLPLPCLLIEVIRKKNRWSTVRQIFRHEYQGKTNMMNVFFSDQAKSRIERWTNELVSIVIRTSARRVELNRCNCYLLAHRHSQSHLSEKSLWKINACSSFFSLHLLLLLDNQSYHCVNWWIKVSAAVVDLTNHRHDFSLSEDLLDVRYSIGQERTWCRKMLIRILIYLWILHIIITTTINGQVTTPTSTYDITIGNVRISIDRVTTWHLTLRSLFVFRRCLHRSRRRNDFSDDGKCFQICHLSLQSFAFVVAHIHPSNSHPRRKSQSDRQWTRRGNSSRR